MRLVRHVRSLAVVLVASTAFVTPARAQSTIGDPLISRSVYDGYAGFILISPYSFFGGALGQSVTGVSIFNGVAGRDFTPVLLASSGAGAWTITGVGTQRVVAASGLQSYSFGLTQGSDVITSSTRVGWRSSSQGGTIPFDYDADGNIYTYSPNGVGPSTVGAVFGQEGTTDRAYSIQFSSSVPVTATPEPSSVVLTASGLIALAGVVRRRRS